MEALKRFVTAVLRIASALIVASLAIMLIVLLYGRSQEAAESKRNKPLEAKKVWPADKLPGGMSVNVATAWRDSKLYYQLNVSGASRENVTIAETAQLHLIFRDADGFKLFTKQVAFAEMTREVENFEQAGVGADADGYSWAGDEYLVADDYRRATQLDFTSSGVYAAPPKSAPVRVISSAPLPEPSKNNVRKWQSRELWRRLQIGMTEEAVRTLLGEPTRVRRYSSAHADFEYGSLVYGGSVTFVSGQVSSWSEP